MSIVLMAAAMLVTGMCIGWFLLARQVPENAASHEDRGQDGRSTPSDDMYTDDRPAGPDAETFDPRTLGGDQSPPQPPDNTAR